MNNILSYGLSIPCFQIENHVFHPQRGKKKGKRAIIFSDEDPVTLAFDAASKCLENYAQRQNDNVAGEKIDAVLFTSTTPVFKNRYHASFLADMLEIPKGILALDLSSSPRAGSDALLMADCLLSTNRYNTILVLAAATYFPPVGDELILGSREGHAGCAFLLGSRNGIAEIKLSQTYSSFVAEEFIYKNTTVQSDIRFGRDAGFMSNLGSSLKSFLDTRGLKPDDFDAVILNSLYAKYAVGLFKKTGFNVENQLFIDSIRPQTGSTGVCHALMLLIDCLEKNSGSILFIDYYNGTNIFRIEQTERINTNGNTIEEWIKDCKPIENYQDYLTLEKAGNIDSEAYKNQKIFFSEIMLEREKENIIHLKGFKCNQCSTVYFIKTQRCNKCNSEEFTLKKLSKTGTVFTFTREYYFPTAFPPLTMAVVDLDGGGRMTLQVTDEMYPDKMSETLIGAKVKLVLRKMIENDVKPNYFWKCILI